MVNTLGLYLGERERRGLRRAAGWNGASRIVNLVYFEVPVSTCSYKWPHAGGNAQEPLNHTAASSETTTSHAWRGIAHEMHLRPQAGRRTSIHGQAQAHT